MKKKHILCGVVINDTYDGMKQGRTKRVFFMMGELYMEITKMNLFKKLQDRKKCLLLTFMAFVQTLLLWLR